MTSNPHPLYCVMIDMLLCASLYGTKQERRSLHRDPGALLNDAVIHYQPKLWMTAASRQFWNAVSIGLLPTDLPFCECRVRCCSTNLRLERRKWLSCTNARACAYDGEEDGSGSKVQRLGIAAETRSRQWSAPFTNGVSELGQKKQRALQL